MGRPRAAWPVNSGFSAALAASLKRPKPLRHPATSAKRSPAEVSRELKFIGAGPSWHSSHNRSARAGQDHPEAVREPDDRKRSSSLIEERPPALLIAMPDLLQGMSNTVAPQYHEDAGFLATSLSPETTGVHGASVWIFAGEPTRNQSALGPRVLVVLGERLTADSLVDAVPVRLTIPPEVLGTLPPTVTTKAIEFATRNRDVLIEYWKGDLSTVVAIGRLVRC